MNEDKLYTLLIVDDESIERDAIKFILNKADLPKFNIVEASNGQEAISETALSEPDIILMDIQMPGLNGIEATKVIKKINPSVKVIFLTAYNQFDYAHEAIKLGVEEFIIKPATNDRFIKVIKSTIEDIEATKVIEQSREEMELKLLKVSKYLEKEFVMALITGDVDEVQTKEYLDFHDIDLRCAMGVVIHLDINAESIPSNIQQQMIKKRFLEKLKMKFDSFLKRYYSIIVKEYIYVLIFNDTINELLQAQQMIRSVVVEVGDYYSNQHNTYSDFFIGDPYDEVSKVWKSFAKAKSECNKKTIHKSMHDKEVIDMMVKAIINHNETIINEQCSKIDSLFASFDIEGIRFKLHEIAILIKDGLTNQASIETITNTNLISRIINIENCPEGKRLLRQICHDYLEQVATIKVDKTSIVMDKIITYINVHYNENITLEQLADISGRSTSYLSKLFKKQVDMNFVDYLAFIRIKVAKRMLKNPEYSIKETAYEIGYGDPNYFTRVFKKYVDMTPSEYRCKHMIKE